MHCDPAGGATNQYDKSDSMSGGDGNWCAPLNRHTDLANVTCVAGHVTAMRLSSFFYAGSPFIDPAKSQ